jgi:hypothetical protein
VASGQSSVALGVSTASGSAGFAAGDQNEAKGVASVALGESCVASTNYTFALGQRAKANHNGTFVWADSQVADFSSTSNNQFLIRASGGVGVGTPSPSRELEVQNSGDVEIGLKSTDNGGHLWTLQSSSLTGSPNLDASFQIIDRTGGGARLLIGTNGNIGIGTPAPQGRLHVAGSTILQGLITPAASAATNLLNLGSGSTADGFRNGLSFFEASGAPSMTFGYDGTGSSAQNALRVYNSSGTSLFTFQANGNMGVGTNTPGALLQVGNATCNGTTWANASDRDLKENFAVVSACDVLAKVAALPITRWNYKSEPDQKHVGPMAQDFYATFNVGADDKHIATIDESGVALAAIQGLNQKLERLSSELKRSETENSELKARLEKLEYLVR